MSTSTDELAPDLLERVLSRLGLSAPPSPDLYGLKTVYAAWCRQVPFDNIRKLIHVQTQNQGVLPGDSAQDFFEAWLKDKTGGTCWAGNGALHRLLVTLGFAAHRGVATMLVAPLCRRTMALSTCSSMGCAIWWMRPSCTANRSHWRRGRTPPLRIPCGGSGASSSTTTGISASVRCTCPQGWSVALSSSRRRARTFISVMNKPVPGVPLTTHSTPASFRVTPS